MSYIVNQNKDNEVERLTDNNRKYAYKNITFKNMKDAYNYKTYIINSELEKMGITIYNTPARRFYGYSIYFNELAQKRLDCESLLSTRAKQYEDGFFSTAEWGERDRINTECLLLRKQYSAVILEGLEYFHIDIVKRYPNEAYGNSIPTVLSALYYNKFNSMTGTDELRKYTNNWRAKAQNIASEINKKVYEYKILDNRTKTGIPEIDNLKNQAIRLNEELESTISILRSLYAQNMVVVPGQSRFMFKKVKDLSSNDVFIDSGYRYNLYHYLEDSENVYNLNFIYPINGRMAIISERKYILLRNDDWVIVDTKFDGEKLNYKNINSIYPYLNTNERSAYAPRPKDFDGSDRMKDFFDIEDGNRYM